MRTGTEMEHVPYKGNQDALIDVINGQVAMTFSGLPPLLSNIQAGKLRPIFIAGDKRLAALPDVPTMREQGLDMVVGSWQGIYVPKGTAAPVVKKLFDVAHETMKHPEVMKRMADSGVSIVTRISREDFAKFWKSEHERFA